MAAHHKKIENVLKLESSARCDYFVRKVADSERVWGLFDNGWATARAGSALVVPFWPEEDFAMLCAGAEWQGFGPKSIELSDFLSRWIPGMQADGRLCQVFPTPEEQGGLMEPEAIAGLIRKELQQYQ